MAKTSYEQKACSITFFYFSPRGLTFDINTKGETAYTFMCHIKTFSQQWTAYTTVVPSDYNEAETFLSPSDT